MKILAADIGTGTQDVLLFDSDEPIENAMQLILPSPTVIVAGKVRRATQLGAALVLSGTTMGGGPCAWAVEDHLRAGLQAYATPDAARTFDDDLSRVEQMGIRLIEPSEIERLEADGVAHVEMRDFDPDALLGALASFGVDTAVDALAVAVFDHGNSPPGYSDRRFRFDYLAERLQAGGRDNLAAFAFMSDQIPESMTRLQSVASSVRGPLAQKPLLVMDTAPAAILGSLEDVAVREAAAESALLVNIGNFHVIGFHMSGGRVAGLLEHHTGELSPEQLAALLRDLAAGTLTNEQVFYSQGHGAIVLEAAPPPVLLAVTGPRRTKLPAGLVPWPLRLAVPHGDMMLTGCFALLRALAYHWPAASEPVEQVLGMAKAR